MSVVSKWLTEESSMESAGSSLSEVGGIGCEAVQAVTLRYGTVWLVPWRMSAEEKHSASQQGE